MLDEFWRQSVKGRPADEFRSVPAARRTEPTDILLIISHIHKITAALTDQPVACPTEKIKFFSLFSRTSGPCPSLAQFRPVTVESRRELRTGSAPMENCRRRQSSSISVLLPTGALQKGLHPDCPDRGSAVQGDGERESIPGRVS